MEVRRTTEYVIQQEYRGGPVDDPIWYWRAHHKTFDTAQEAFDFMEGMSPRPPAFSRGQPRVVKRTTVITETVEVRP